MCGIEDAPVICSLVPFISWILLERLYQSNYHHASIYRNCYKDSTIIKLPILRNAFTQTLNTILHWSILYQKIIFSILHDSFELNVWSKKKAGTWKVRQIDLQRKSPKCLGTVLVAMNLVLYQYHVFPIINANLLRHSSTGCPKKKR